MEKTEQSKRQMLLDAANHLRTAIDLLDGAAASGQIAAQVDFALHQLLDAIAIIPEPAKQKPDLPGEVYEATRTSALRR